MELFVFLLRDYEVDSESRYDELIPKLFYPESKTIEPYSDDKIPKNKDEYEAFFLEMLSDKNNLLHGSKDHESKKLSGDVIAKIIELNLQKFKETKWTSNSFKGLVKHLKEGHTDMEYGLYFGCLKSDSGVSGIRKHFSDAEQNNSNKQVVYYAKLDTLLDYIDERKLGFQTCHFNDSWRYGVIDGGTIRYDPSKRDQFKKSISKYTNKILSNSELICRIPLPEKLFNSLYGKLTLQRNTLYGGGSSKSKKSFNKLPTKRKKSYKKLLKSKSKSKRKSKGKGKKHRKGKQY